MLVLDAMTELRRRYFICKGARHVVEIAPEIGVTRKTLSRFGHGGFLREHATVAIEAWLEQEEGKHAAATRERTRHGDAC